MAKNNKLQNGMPYHTCTCEISQTRSMTFIRNSLSVKQWEMSS